MSDGPFSMIAGIAGAAGNVISQHMANETNIQLAREQRDFYYQQWLRENAYNDPKAQMARLQAAGLNPALMYGDGASGMQGSASMADVEAARVAAPQVDPLTLAQIANLNAQTEKTTAEVGEVKEKTELAKAQTDWTRGQIAVGESVVMYNRALTDYTKEQQKKVASEMEVLAAQVKVANSTIEKIAAEIQNMSEQRKIDWYNASLRSKEVDALVDKYAAETAFTKEQTKYYAALALAKVLNLNSDTALNEARKGLTEAQTREVDQAISNMIIQGGQMAFDFLQNQKYDDATRTLNQARLAADVVQSIYGTNPEALLGATLKVDAFNDLNKMQRTNVRTP